MSNLTLELPVIGEELQPLLVFLQRLHRLPLLFTGLLLSILLAIESLFDAVVVESPVIVASLGGLSEQVLQTLVVLILINLCSVAGQVSLNMFGLCNGLFL